MTPHSIRHKESRKVETKRDSLNDYREHDIDLEKLGSYLKLHCRQVHLKTHDIVAPVDNPIY